MARTPQDVPKAELDILHVLWQQGSCSVRQIAESVADGPVTPARVASVQTLLNRLEAKGYVERDRSGSVQQFRAAVGREDLIGRRLRDIADQLCEGSVTPLLTHLVSGEQLSVEDRRRLRDLIDEMDAADDSPTHRPKRNP